MGDTTYADTYRNINFREHPELYKIGKGEQGVLIAEPYKSEILPHWKFATIPIAQKSAETIYEMFCNYAKQDDFVGMDMARKYLQMGFTRARRYANHPSGKKYDDNGVATPQSADCEVSEKAQAAQIFYKYYVRAKNDTRYLDRKAKHQANHR